MMSVTLSVHFPVVKKCAEGMEHYEKAPESCRTRAERSHGCVPGPEPESRMTLHRSDPAPPLRFRG